MHVSFHANVHLSVGLFEEKTFKTQHLKPLKLKVHSGAQTCQLIVGLQVHQLTSGSKYLKKKLFRLIEWLIQIQMIRQVL